MLTWILPGSLAGMPQPNGAENVRVLARQGVTAVISLSEHAEWIGGAVLREGMSWLHLPIRDFHAPDPGQIDDAVRFIRNQIAEGGGVAVHCTAGLGRTGTVIACYLVSKGYDPYDAIQSVRQARPGSVETDEQERAIRDYYLSGLGRDDGIAAADST